MLGARLMLRLLLFIFISLTLLPNPAFSKGEKKKLKIGLLLRLAETYDPTPIAIQEGVKAAKQIFEKKYPEFNIEISEYKHGNDFNSVILASRQIVKDHPIAVIGGEKKFTYHSYRRRISSHKNDTGYAN
jgi:ABC-type uncharacterized transport system substrate-binding protein